MYRRMALRPVFIGHQFSPSLVHAAQGDMQLLGCSPEIGAIARQRVRMGQEQTTCNVTQTWEARREAHLWGANKRLISSRREEGTVADWQGEGRKGARVEYVVEPLGTSPSSRTVKGGHPSPLA